MSYEDVTITSDGQEKIHGWFISANSARATLLFCHGNAGNISHRLESIQQFNRMGLNVFIFDYPGYGKSDGRPNEQSTYRAALSAYNYLVNQRAIPPEQIVIFGRSLGGAIAAWLAANCKAHLLIVESSFTSIGDAAAFHYPYIPARLLMRFDFNSKQLLENINIPVLIVHSPDDEIIPFKHGQELFKAANEPKQFLEISGSHNDGYIISGDHYENGINSFLEIYLPKKS
jgi:hypothetical protein